MQICLQLKESLKTLTSGWTYQMKEICFQQKNCSLKQREKIVKLIQEGNTL